jgi:hypothetical protein
MSHYLPDRFQNVSNCFTLILVALAGGAIEAILMDRLMRDSSKALATKKAPTKNRDISGWRFEELIDVAIELQLIGRGADGDCATIRSHGVRVRYRRRFRGRCCFY